MRNSWHCCLPWAFVLANIAAAIAIETNIQTPVHLKPCFSKPHALYQHRNQKLKQPNLSFL
jgi:hypothetical protein